MAKPNYPMRVRSTALDVELIAYPVGDNRDSYSIEKWFAVDTHSNETTVQCVVFKNWTSTTRAEKLFTGTYSECYKFIEETISSL